MHEHRLKNVGADGAAYGQQGPGISWLPTRRAWGMTRLMRTTGLEHEKEAKSGISHIK